MAKVQLINGAFQDASGNPLANGTLLVQLSQDALLSGGQGQVSGEIKVAITLDSSGNVLGSSTSPSGPNQYLWPTDEMTPSGVSYTVWAYAFNGQLAWGPNYNLTVPTGSTYDLGNWAPNLTIAPLASLGGLTIQVNGVAVSLQNVLNLVAGSGIVLTAGGGGTITIST